MDCVHPHIYCRSTVANPLSWQGVSVKTQERDAEMCIWIGLLAPVGSASADRSWWSFGSVRHGRRGCPDGRPGPRHHRRRRRDLLHRQLHAAPRRTLALLPSISSTFSFRFAHHAVTFGHAHQSTTCGVQKSFEELDEKYSEFDESGGRQRRARRRAERERKRRND